MAQWGEELEFLKVGETRWDLSSGLNTTESIVQMRPMHVTDVMETDAYREDNPAIVPAKAENIRTFLAIPLVHKGKGIGNIALYRREVKPFSPIDIALVESFADQAVIAIENARLMNETQAALARQTASANVLRVISESPTDAQPVFEAIVTAATALVSCDIVVAALADRDTWWQAAVATPKGLSRNIGDTRHPLDPDDNFQSAVLLDGKTCHIPDLSAPGMPRLAHKQHTENGFEVYLGVPLIRGGVCLGGLTFIRKTKRRFRMMTSRWQKALPIRR